MQTEKEKEMKEVKEGYKEVKKREERKLKTEGKRHQRKKGRKE